MLQHILLIFTSFMQWFIYTFMQDDASMAKRDKVSWQKAHTDLNCIQT